MIQKSTQQRDTPSSVMQYSLSCCRLTADAQRKSVEMVGNSRVSRTPRIAVCAGVFSANVRLWLRRLWLRLWLRLSALGSQRGWYVRSRCAACRAAGRGGVRNVGAAVGGSVLASFFVGDASDAELRGWGVGIAHAVSITGNFAQAALPSSNRCGAEA